MVLKTREKLIEVARQLFARKGLENTTMNDIANASDKGRRTIYTYFKNKREIYNAVLERESEQLVSSLREVVDNKSLGPEEKLRRYLEVRFKILSEAVNARDDSLLTRITRDMRRSDRIRRIALVKETEFFQSIMNEGVAAGIFDPVQCKRLIAVQSFMFLGVDYSQIRNHTKEIGITSGDTPSTMVDFLTAAVLKK